MAEKSKPMNPTLAGSWQFLRFRASNGSARRPQTVSARRPQAASKPAGNRTSATAVATIPNTTMAGTAHIVATSAPSPRGAERGRAFDCGSTRTHSPPCIS